MLVFIDELCVLQDAVLVVAGWAPGDMMAVGETLCRLRDDVGSELTEVMPEATALSWLALAGVPFSELLGSFESPPGPWPLAVDCIVSEDTMPLSRVEPA